MYTTEIVIQNGAFTYISFRSIPFFLHMHVLSTRVIAILSKNRLILFRENIFHTHINILCVVIEKLL